jgi:hypothetical protein
MVKVSLFASSVRPKFYQAFFDSLNDCSESCEVVFAGNLIRGVNIPVNCEFYYHTTANIKPCQCYEIARRACVGEVVVWVADDCEFKGDIIGRAYKFWKEQKNEKLVISLQTNENRMFCNMNFHAFFGWRGNSPLMAPLGMMSREYLDRLGGYDRRYICGQGENDIVMRVLADGGEVRIFGDKESYIDIDHYAKHGIVRPFAEGYNHDRSILEKSWTDGRGNVIMKRTDEFEPFEDQDILTKSQSFNLARWA